MKMGSWTIRRRIQKHWMVDYRAAITCFPSWRIVYSAIKKKPKTQYGTVHCQPLVAFNGLNPKLLSVVGWLEFLSMKLCLFFTTNGLGRTMPISKWKLAIVIASAITGTGAGRTLTAVDQLQPLVESSARRLVIAEQVALAKWDDGAAVEDAPREAHVIMGAVNLGESRGLNPTSVSNFFKAKIEANKVVQYSLLADWHRSGRAPMHAPIDLVGKIRPELDTLQTALITELMDTAAIRASPTCPADVARTVGKYVAAHRHDFGSLQAMALDRALAATST
jgi:chorismate mutase